MGWKVKKLWGTNEIAGYGAFVAAAAEKRIGNQKCTCEDLAVDLIIDFADENALPIGFVNDKHSRGLTPERFADAEAFSREVRTSTGATDVLRAAVDVHTVPAGRTVALAHARPGDFIYTKDGGAHIQVVTAAGDGEVVIMQGNVNKKWWGNSSDPYDDAYVGMTVAPASYKRGADRQWRYTRSGANPNVFTDGKGRVMRWNFSAFNSLVVPHKVAPGDDAHSIGQQYYGQAEWVRVYATFTPPELAAVRPGQRLYLWLPHQFWLPN